MATEKFANNAITTTTGSINNSSNPVTFTVTDASKFPTTGQFRVLIDLEILLVTTVSGSNFTASRAQEGTSIATHSSGATVTHIVTSASLIQALKDANTAGTYASAPAAERDGKLYFPSDSPFLLRDNGSGFDPYGLIRKMTPPPLTGWSWDNQGSSTIDTTLGTLLLENSTPTVNDTHIRYRTAPSAPYTIDIYHDALEVFDTFWRVGFGWRHSGTGKLVMFAPQPNASFSSGYPGYQLQFLKYDSHLTFNGFYSSYGTGGVPLMRYPNWIRIKDDNTNLLVSYSLDGISWAQAYSAARTNFLTSPDQVFFAMLSSSASRKVANHVISWNQY